MDKIPPDANREHYIVGDRGFVLSSAIFSSAALCSSFGQFKSHPLRLGAILEASNVYCIGASSLLVLLELGIDILKWTYGISMLTSGSVDGCGHTNRQLLGSGVSAYAVNNAHCLLIILCLLIHTVYHFAVIRSDASQSRRSI